VTKLCFSDLGLIEPIRRALTAENYVHPTPIQAQAIPLLLAGKDLLGIAQTGTGKTAAFALPIMQRLTGAPAATTPRGARVLVLAPTRELAIQIGESFRVYGKNLKLRHAVVFGGVSQHGQVAAMARGVDVLIATPGRLLDLLNQRLVRLDTVGVLVLDEADRMLDMGFIRDVRKIVATLPKKRQSLCFSATMPTEVAKLASQILIDPVRIEVAPAATTVEQVQQFAFFVNTADKRALLNKVLEDPRLGRVIVFTRTKHGANRVAKQLGQAGVAADAIHGNKSQAARQRALESFRAGQVRVLVATDIAARGIDVDGITHVINYELPNIPESYVHRIGRTARAGASGAAFAFCDPSERAYLRDIEKLTRQPLVVVEVRKAPGSGHSAETAPSRPAYAGNGRRRHRNARGRRAA
jgi:ATP-dependent RNA helicase RhlE